MASIETIQYHLGTLAGYRVLRFEKDPRELEPALPNEPEHAWPRGYFLWHLLMQLRSVSQLLYIERTNVPLAGGRLAQLEQRLRERGIPHERVLPQGIERLWYRLGRMDYMELRMGGIPIEDDPLLTLAIQSVGPVRWFQMYAVSAPVTPWFRLCDKARELEGSKRGWTSAMWVVSQTSDQYLEFLDECVCAIYVTDNPYEYELHTAKLSDDQMLAIFSEAASRYGLSIAQGSAMGPSNERGEEDYRWALVGHSVRAEIERRRHSGKRQASRQKIDYSDYSATVEIDGASMPISVITTHFQKDPFPGGHRYNLRLAGSRLEWFFDPLSHGTISILGKHPSEEIFQSLEIIASGIRARDLDWQPHRYMLNNIERVTFTGRELAMEGVCSEVVRRPDSKPI